MENIWLSADYHFPSLYSIKIPDTSKASAKASPGPGPATVRLALIRTGIEFFGIEYTRDVLFPVIRSADIRIRPPEKIVIYSHTIKAYKTEAVYSNEVDYQDTIINREYAYSKDHLTIYLNSPSNLEDKIRELFFGIGYWGQSESMTSCIGVKNYTPNYKECVTPITSLNPIMTIGGYFVCFLTEFFHPGISWEDIFYKSHMKAKKFIIPSIFVWPLRYSIGQKRSIRLIRTIFTER